MNKSFRPTNHKFSSFFKGLCLSLLFLSYGASANLIVNPGVESIVNDEFNLYDNDDFGWEVFVSQGAWVTQPFDNSQRSGNASFAMGTFEPDSFAGIYQDIYNISANEILLFSGWARSFEEGSGIEVRIEWLDEFGSLLSQTQNLTPTPGQEYEFFHLQALVPELTAVARVVFAVQSFTGITNQVVFADDFSFTIEEVPSPNVLALLGLSLVLIGFKRHY